MLVWVLGRCKVVFHDVETAQRLRALLLLEGPARVMLLWRREKMRFRRTALHRHLLRHVGHRGRLQLHKLRVHQQLRLGLWVLVGALAYVTVDRHHFCIGLSALVAQHA